jgi:hypothetical protein
MIENRNFSKKFKNNKFFGLRRHKQKLVLRHLYSLPVQRQYHNHMRHSGVPLAAYSWDGPELVLMLRPS